MQTPASNNNNQLTNALRFPQVGARVFDTPLLIEQGKLGVLLEVLGPRLGFESMSSGASLAYADPGVHAAAMQQRSAERRDEGYYVVNGVAVVPVIGTLVQRSDWMSSMSGMVSYDKIATMMAAAMRAYDVREIVMEIDSPGGEVAGAFDLADQIYNMRGDKPITAIATEFAASAAYLIASAADEIVVPRTGMVGSIGVVSAHYDYSKALDKKGVAVTFIYAGDKKVDGNAFEPLPPEVKAEWQAMIDSVYQLFVDTVARNLDIGADRVRGTQAGMFMGFKAVDAGLATRVNTFANELGNSVLRQSGGQFRLDKPRKEVTMETKDTKFTQADVDKARAEGHTAGKTEAVAAQPAPAAAAPVAPAVAAADPKAERDRIKAITTHAEAKGRETLANHLAYETDMSADEAGKLLASSAKDSKESKLDKAMAGNRPGVRAEEGAAPQGGVKAINANDVYARRQAEAQKIAATAK